MTYQVIIFTFILACSLVYGYSRTKKVLFVHESSQSTTAVLTILTDNGEIKRDGCAVFPHTRFINWNAASRAMQIRKLPDYEMKNLLRNCLKSHHQRQKRDTDDTTDISTDPDVEANEIENEEHEELSKANETEKGGVIFPGTKWCGAGDKADNYDDLGSSEGTDKCCRAHDYCNDTLAPGESRYNLTNSNFYTALSCDCDDTFYQCLLDDGSTTSNLVGFTFFDLLGSACYAYDYPLSDKCKTYRTFLKLYCSEYEKDTSEEKRYGFYPAKSF